MTESHPTCTQVEIFDGVSVLHIFCDTAPLKEYSAWQKDRISLYRKFEPTAALLDASPRKVEGITPTRLRLRGASSDALWRIILQGNLSQGTQQLLHDVQMEGVAEARSLMEAHNSLALMPSNECK